MAIPCCSERVKGSWFLNGMDRHGKSLKRTFRAYRFRMRWLIRGHGVLWACVDHGHWAQKLYRASHVEADFEELPAPKNPDDAVMYDLWDEDSEKPAAVGIRPGPVPSL